MSERAALKPADKPATGSYFTKVHKGKLKFIPSGCKLLDCVLGGGWPLGRISNVVGDKSSGKTLLAIESCTNFNMEYPDGLIYYMEAEAAFDQDYAAALGMPIDAIDFLEDRNENTIEELFELLDTIIEVHEKNKLPGLFIVDSLDALSDRAELGRKIDEGSYGGSKPKKMSEMFRRLAARLEETNIHLKIISQVRDNIGAMVGAKHTRSGGRALDFYASQVLWLREVKKHKKTSKGIQRIIGVQVRAQCKKNKVGLPFRECEFPIYFGYGVDDLAAHIEFLNIVSELKLASDVLGTDIADTLDSKKQGALIRKMRGLRGKEMRDARKVLDVAVVEAWEKIEKAFMPVNSKY